MMINKLMYLMYIVKYNQVNDIGILEIDDDGLDIVPLRPLK